MVPTRATRGQCRLSFNLGSGLVEKLLVASESTIQCARDTGQIIAGSQNLCVVGTMQVAFRTGGGMQVTCVKIVKNPVFEDANRINADLIPTLHAMVIGANEKNAIISDLPFQRLQNMLET